MVQALRGLAGLERGDTAHPAIPRWEFGPSDIFFPSFFFGFNQTPKSPFSVCTYRLVPVCIFRRHRNIFHSLSRYVSEKALRSFLVLDENTMMNISQNLQRLTLLVLLRNSFAAKCITDSFKHVFIFLLFQITFKVIGSSFKNGSQNKWNFISTIWKHLTYNGFLPNL